MRLGLFQRAIGLVVLGTAVGAGALLWYAVATGGPRMAESPREGVLFGVWRVFYDTQAPTLRVLLAAAALALLLAAGVALVERRIATRTRRSVNHRTTPLAPKIVMAGTRGTYAGRVTVQRHRRHPPGPSGRVVSSHPHRRP